MKKLTLMLAALALTATAHAGPKKSENDSNKYVTQAELDKGRKVYIKMKDGLTVRVVSITPSDELAKKLADIQQEGCRLNLESFEKLAKHEMVELNSNGGFERVQRGAKVKFSLRAIPVRVETEDGDHALTGIDCDGQGTGCTVEVEVN